MIGRTQVGVHFTDIRDAVFQIGVQLGEDGAVLSTGSDLKELRPGLHGHHGAVMVNADHFCHHFGHHLSFALGLGLQLLQRKR